MLCTVERSYIKILAYIDHHYIYVLLTLFEDVVAHPAWLLIRNSSTVLDDKKKPRPIQKIYISVFKCKACEEYGVNVLSYAHILDVVLLILKITTLFFFQANDHFHIIVHVRFVRY